jgi:DNA-binding LacI/PurR family transcriptional regulator
MHGIGREAVRLLINALEDPSLASQHVRIPAKLMVRGSTNQCASNG